MPILHKNITAETDIHNPKWFSNANNGDYAWKNEQGNLESIDELLLPAALNFVDGSVAPPTSNVGDIYVLSSGGSVNAGWGSVSLQDWVRYDGAAWNSITPQKSSLCYNENTDKLLTFDGTAWAALGGDNIYTADGTLSGARTADLDLNILTFDVGTFSGSGVDKGIVIDGSNYQITNTGATNAFFEVLNQNGIVFNALQRGGILSYSDVNSLANLVNRANTKGLRLDTNNSRLSSNELIFNNSFVGNQGIYQRGSGTTNDFFFRDSSNVIQHWLRQGDSLAQATFFRNGINGLGFLVGDSSAIGSEDISLQAQTAIKGNGTTTGTTLALYDNDTTPNKTWEWLDNGNVSINQNTDFNLNSNLLTFNALNIGALKDPYIEYMLNGGLEIISTDTDGSIKVIDCRISNTNTVFQVGRAVNSNGTWNQQNIKIGKIVDNDYLEITASSFNFIDGGTVRHKFTGTKAILSGNAFIGTEDISLQGDTLLNANVNMPNLPTSSAGLSSGDIYNDSGTLKIV